MEAGAQLAAMDGHDEGSGSGGGGASLSFEEAKWRGLVAAAGLAQFIGGIAACGVKDVAGLMREAYPASDCVAGAACRNGAALLAATGMKKMQVKYLVRALRKHHSGDGASASPPPLPPYPAAAPVALPAALLPAAVVLAATTAATSAERPAHEV